MLKIATERKKLKTMGHMTLVMDYYLRNGQMGDTDPPLTCHANQSNEYCITLTQGCIEIMLQYPIK